jgi:hypothetical protein
MPVWGIRGSAFIEPTNAARDTSRGAIRWAGYEPCTLTRQAHAGEDRQTEEAPADRRPAGRDGRAGVNYYWEGRGKVESGTKANWRDWGSEPKCLMERVVDGDGGAGPTGGCVCARERVKRGEREQASGWSNEGKDREVLKN